MFKIRALDVNKTFIEEIGFEWNDFTPNDLISNQITSQGFIDVNREWSIGVNTSNNLPSATLDLPFASTFGQGFRGNFTSMKVTASSTW